MDMPIALMVVAILLEIPVFGVGFALIFARHTSKLDWTTANVSIFAGAVYTFLPLGLLRFDTVIWAVLLEAALLAVALPLIKWVHRGTSES